MPEAKRPRIIGIALLKNEDIFATLAIRSVIDFCDEIIVLDHLSDDATWQRLSMLADEHPRKIMLMRVRNALHTHRLVMPYAGRRVFMMGIDGDEIYDSSALARLRTAILAGVYDQAWCLYGHVLHCVALDLVAMAAMGYQTPTARSMTKIYNFSIIRSWKEPNQQRLHGRKIVFKPGFSLANSVRSFQQEPWETVNLRCLHMCFLPRSTISPPDLDGGARKNISEHHTSLDLGPGWKHLHYAKGDLVTRDARPFFAHAPDEVDRLHSLLAQAPSRSVPEPVSP